MVYHQTPMPALKLQVVYHQTLITALKLHMVYHQTPMPALKLQVVYHQTLITALKLHMVYHQTPMPALKLQVVYHQTLITALKLHMVYHQTPMPALKLQVVYHQTPITALKLHVVYHQTPITLITALKLHTVYHQTPMPALKLQVTPITSATNHSESINCAQLPRSPHNWPLEPHPLSCWGNLILQLFVWPHQVAHHLSNPPDGGISVESHQTRSKVFWDGQRHEVGAWVQAVHDRQLNHSGRLHLISGGWGDKEGMVTTSACKGADRLQWEIVHNREAESLWLFPSDLWRLGR